MIGAHRFDPTILREYDVRGVIGKTLSPTDAEALGRAFGTCVRRAGGKRVTVGRDGRLSSPDMEAVVVAGLRAAGIDVLRVGGCPTPGLYFSVYELKADGGIMITGSHNPPDYNGFKMMIGTRPFFGADIQTLGPIAAEGSYAEGHGSVEDVDLFEAGCGWMTRDQRWDQTFPCGREG